MFKVIKTDVIHSIKDFDPIQIDKKPKFSFSFFQFCVFAFCKVNVFIFRSLLNIILPLGRCVLGRWVGWSVVGGSVIGR